MQQSEAMHASSTLDLNQTLRSGRIEPARLRSQLDALDSSTRVAAIRSLGRRAQANLFEAVQGHKPLTLAALVPDGVPAMSEVVHEGKNSLPLFSTFAKVFCRPEGNTPELWGYNRGTALIENAVGPGYYVAYEQAGEVMVDYTRLPTHKPARWPEILPNEARLGRFVFAGLVDVLRGVSEHVTIGRALRGGKPVDNWFVLCRVD